MIRSNISPTVLAAVQKGAGPAPQAEFSAAPQPTVESTVDETVPVVVEEPEVLPENDNPPQPPTDGAYGYQTKVVITPSRARHIITLNAENNRNKKESKIARMARDMRKGLWLDETGETIKISRTGQLIDGQNRMFAVERSGATIVVDIAWNVPDDRMGVIDDVSPRTTSDDFKIQRVADRYNGGALVKWALAWEKSNYMNYGGRLTPTRSEIRVRYQMEPQTFDAAALFGKASKHALATVKPSAAAMAFWLFSKVDGDSSEQAEKFFDQFMSGLQLEPGSPVAALRNRFIASQKPLTAPQQLCLMIKAWNAFRAPRVSASVTSRVQLPKDGLTNENFPMPI